ncbi:TPA: hypothetical protein KQG29_001471 [Clostridioides difficile]|nr:hypothetical protein [Clostridioides difficile]HBG5344107.1 hypothetical protein [Clostridioides difficile]
MKWLKMYAITVIFICIIICSITVVASHKAKIITTQAAFDLVDSKVPNEAKYEGYKKDQVNGTTILYYSYNDACHIVKLFHQTDDFTREIKWDKVLDIKFD